MDIEHLRWFVEVARREHVTEAAAGLHVSQPALSRALARLEVELGTPLFDRRGRSLRLNRHGAAFRVRAERALAELDLARHELSDATAAETGTVALAFGPTFGPWRVPELLAAYRVLHPAVGFQLREGGADAMRRWLLDGDVDLILTGTRPAGAEFAWSALTHEQLELAVPTRHALAQQSAVYLRALAREQFVALKPGFTLRNIGDQLCQRAGFTPAVTVETDDPATVRSLVAAGIGIAIVPADDRKHAAGSSPIHYLSLRDRGTTRTIGMAWMAERYRSAAVEQFRTFVLDDSPQSAR